MTSADDHPGICRRGRRARDSNPLFSWPWAELETNLRPFALVDAPQRAADPLRGSLFRPPSVPPPIATARARPAFRRLGPAPSPTRPGQPARWALLGRAAAIDREAAFESTSWGMGQVMGAHWDWLGYTSVDALVTEAKVRHSGSGPPDGRLHFDRSGLSRALGNHDWQGLCAGLQRPGLPPQCLRHPPEGGVSFATPGGSAGTRSACCAQARRARTYASCRQPSADTACPLPPTACSDRATERSVRVFQQRSGLPETGIACTATLAAIDQSPPPQTRTAAALHWSARKWRAARKR